MGVICDILCRFAEEKGGRAGLESIRQEAGLPGREFRWEEIVPEKDWQALLDAAAKGLGVDRDTAERVFAEYAIGVLSDKFGSLFRACDTPLDFLRRVPKIHLDFPSSMGAATREKLKLASDQGNRIVYHYDSPNRLCVFLTALAEQVFKKYKATDYSIEETRCKKRGAARCEIVIGAG